MIKKITNTTTIKEILKMRNGEKILSKHNLPCLSCPMAAQEIEKLEIGAVSEAYSLDIVKILEDLNKSLDKGRKK